MNIRIRSMMPADLEVIAELIAVLPLYRQYGYTMENAAANLREALGDPCNDILVACDGGDPCGVAWVIKDGGFGRSPYLRLIAVDEKYQRNGIGIKLMKEMESRHLKDKGFFLLVTSTNSRARCFYEALGYSSIGELKNFVKEGMIEVIYYKGSSGLC